MTAEKPKVEATCLHCGKPFEKNRSWQEHCSGECRQGYHFNRRCGHGRPIGTCTVVGCQVQEMFNKLAELPYVQCACGQWFPRKHALRQSGWSQKRKYCSDRCRWKAKHEAERVARAAGGPYIAATFKP